MTVSVRPRPKSVLKAFLSALSVFALVQFVWAQSDGGEGGGSVIVTSPAPWSTLRTDSLTVSLQIDTAQLPGAKIDFKVYRRSGSRSSLLFSKSVKADAPAMDVFLGRVKGGVGGSDYLSIEWNAPEVAGLKDTVGPIGIAALNGSVTDDNKWVPAKPYLSAVRLKEGLSGGEAAEALAALSGFKVGGAAFAAGWNASGLYLYFTPTGSVPAAEYALDLKFGANAFTAWADRYVTVSADSAYGSRFSARSVSAKEGLKFDESRWGSGKTVALTENGAGRLVTLDWREMGVLPFEGRNIGFAVFAKGPGGKSAAALPSDAVRSIPGSWGGISLAK